MGGAFSTGPVELVRTDVYERRRVAVIGGVQHDDITAPGVCPRQSQRQLVGLAARIHEVAHPERRRQRRDQPLREHRQLVVQVARVRVKDEHLLGRGADDARMAVTDVRNVVVGIEVLASALVVEILHPAADDLHRRPIGDGKVGTDDSTPRCECLFGRAPAGATECRRDRRRIERREARQRRGDRPLAYTEVRLVRTLALLTRCDAHAHAEAQQNQSEQRIDLVLFEWTAALITPNDGDGGVKGIVFAQHGVSHRDGEVRDHVRMDDVAEIEDAGDLRAGAADVLVASGFSRKIHEHIEIIRIVVHDRAPQAPEPRRVVPLDALQQAGDERARHRIGDGRQQLTTE